MKNKNSKLTLFHKWPSCIIAILMDGLVTIYMGTLEKCVSFFMRIHLNESFKRTSFAYKSLNLLLVQFWKGIVHSWHQPILCYNYPLPHCPFFFWPHPLLVDVNFFIITPPPNGEIELVHFNKIISKLW